MPEDNRTRPEPDCRTALTAVVKSVAVSDANASLTADRRVVCCVLYEGRRVEIAGSALSPSLASRALGRAVAAHALLPERFRGYVSL